MSEWRFILYCGITPTVVSLHSGYRTTTVGRPPASEPERRTSLGPHSPPHSGKLSRHSHTAHSAHWHRTTDSPVDRHARRGGHRTLALPLASSLILRFASQTTKSTHAFAGESIPACLSTPARSPTPILLTPPHRLLTDLKSQRQDTRMVAALLPLKTAGEQGRAANAV
jgi:hypothetical protein